MFSHIFHLVDLEFSLQIVIEMQTKNPSLLAERGGNVIHIYTCEMN